MTPRSGRPTPGQVEAWEVDQLLSDRAGASCSGPLEWIGRAGTLEAHLPVYAAGLAPEGEADLIFRVMIARHERMHAVLRLRRVAVRRACWNAPHREDGVDCGLPTHGHTTRSAGVSRYDEHPPLEPIPRSPILPDYVHRVAFWSFAGWCHIDLGGLQWAQPPLDQEGA